MSERAGAAARASACAAEPDAQPAAAAAGAARAGVKRDAGGPLSGSRSGKKQNSAYRKIEALGVPIVKDVPVHKEDIEGWESLSKNALKRAMKAKQRELQKQMYKDALAKRAAERAPRAENAPFSSERAKARRAELEARCAGGLKLAIDLDADLEKLMTVGEQISLSSQVQRIWGMVKRSSAGINLALAHVNKAGPVYAHMMSLVGIQHWVVDMDERPVQEACPPAESVYLSADADTVLDSLDRSKRYIIGGIVDRNRHKNVCKSKAEELGYSTARLPLAEHVSFVGCAVLTTMHVVEILDKVQSGHDWRYAIASTLPARKLSADDLEYVRTVQAEMGMAERPPREDDEDMTEEEEEETTASERTV